MFFALIRRFYIMNYVERCLYCYRDNLTLLDNSRAELQTVKSLQVQNYKPNSGSGISNPVFEVTAKIISLEQKIKALLRHTMPVKKLFRTLTSINTLRHSQMACILKFRYFAHHSVNKVIREMAISQPTYWRRNGELLRLARQYLNAES